MRADLRPRMQPLREMLAGLPAAVPEGLLVLQAALALPAAPVPRPEPHLRPPPPPWACLSLLWMLPTPSFPNSSPHRT